MPPLSQNPDPMSTVSSGCSSNDIAPGLVCPALLAFSISAWLCSLSFFFAIISFKLFYSFCIKSTIKILVVVVVVM